MDLWPYSDGGRSINTALNALLPYALGDKAWPHEQIRRFDADSLLPALLLSAGQDGQDRDRQAVKTFFQEHAIDRPRR